MVRSRFFLGVRRGAWGGISNLFIMELMAATRGYSHSCVSFLTYVPYHCGYLQVEILDEYVFLVFL